MPSRVLVVDDETGLREMLRLLLARHGHVVEVVDGQTRAVQKLQQPQDFDAVITDLSMPDGSGMGVLEAAKRIDDSIQVIMITAYATTEQAVQAMREGAYDYIQKPFKNDELLAVLEKALEKREIVTQNRALRARVRDGYRSGNLVGKSAAITRVMDLVKRVADAPTSVLVTGESGTGKEMIARALHEMGRRANEPFVALNCAALPEQLLESELFGYEKGAFTGADRRSEGLLRAAGSGTMFLDEVGELPLALQVKLLRVLQERRVRPVGGTREVAIHCRVVAATNRELEQEVAEGRFREDLYYRLNVIKLALPPLRERPEDIPLLAEHFLIKHGAIQDKRLSFAPEALRWLAEQTYRGNVRELENLVERAVTLALGNRLELADLDPEASASAGGSPFVLPAELPTDGFDLDAHLAHFEERVLRKALGQCGGVRKEAARLLGMSFRSFRYRLAKYDGSVGDECDEGSD
ncbi:MAG: sigma-54 dependent transcriptional regulator [Myxococcales bacterium]|nr:sigma-54 dependent transcriptional regulator [Myxococcales bacterium]